MLYYVFNSTVSCTSIIAPTFDGAAGPRASSELADRHGRSCRGRPCAGTSPVESASRRGSRCGSAGPRPVKGDPFLERLGHDGLAGVSQLRQGCGDRDGSRGRTINNCIRLSASARKLRCRFMSVANSSTRSHTLARRIATSISASRDPANGSLSLRRTALVARHTLASVHVRDAPRLDGLAFHRKGLS